MAKLPSLKYVKHVRSRDGKVYAYFNTGRKLAGKTIWAALPPPSTVGFYDSYSVMLGHRTRQANAPASLAAVADDYENSREFKDDLSKGTQRLYATTLKRIREQLGAFPINGVERRHVVEVVEKRIEGNGARNAFLSVLSVLYAYARRKDLTRLEPTKDIKAFKIGEHEPWPEEVLAAGLTADHARTRLAINLLYFTGQRIGDVVQLRWDMIANGAIYMVQQKTAKPLRIPLHSTLRRLLDETPKTGETIITSYQGQPMTPQVVRRELKAFGDMFSLALVPHGLRKNAVNALLEAGCTVPEVAAITGQSFNVVEQYARRVSQHRLGEAAMEKLENRRATLKHVGKSEPQPADSG